MADTLEELSDAGLRELLTAYSITQPVTPSTRSLLIRKLRRQMSAEPRQDDTARTTLASPVAAAQLARPEDGTGVLMDGTTSSPYYGSKAEALVAVMHVSMKCPTPPSRVGWGICQNFCVKSPTPGAE